MGEEGSLESLSLSLFLSSDSNYLQGTYAVSPCAISPLLVFCCLQTSETVSHLAPGWEPMLVESYFVCWLSALGGWGAGCLLQLNLKAFH